MTLEVALAALPQLIVTGLMIGSIYALVALGYYIVHAATGVINFAQGDFVVIGMFMMWLSYVDLQFPLWAALLFTVTTTALFVALFERLGIAPVSNQAPMIPLLVTLAGGLLIRTLIELVWTSRPRPVPPYSGDEPIMLFGAAILPQAIWVIGGTLVTLVLVYLFFKKTLFGLSMLASASDREGARVIGVNPRLISLYAFALCAIISGIAGGLVVPITNANTSLGIDLSLKGFAGAVLGGIERPLAVVVGGLVVGLLEALVAGLISSEYRNLFVFAVLMLVIVLRPQGLLALRASK
jgi:branched-chain amino acid transport system permease protein